MALDFPSNPTDGQIYGSYVYNNTIGAWQSREESATVAVTSPTKPLTANNGDIWYNSNRGIPYVYYDDGTSSQWVEIITSGTPELATKADLSYVNSQDLLKADKTYVDSQDNLKANLSGATFTGDITANNIKSNRTNSVNEGGQLELAKSSDNTTAWTMDAYGNSSTPDLRIFDSSGNVRFRIDGAGRITMGSQPSFLATKSDNGNTYSGDYVFNIALHNTGGHYSTSTGRFTAPSTGRYFFITEIQTYGIGAGTLSTVSFKKNNTIFADSSGGTPKAIVNKAVDSSYHNTIVFSLVMDLAANDYVSVYTENSRGMQSHFSGYLIG